MKPYSREVLPAATSFIALKSHQKGFSEDERMFTQDKEIDELIAEISTREESTLVFSTVTASVSLALLVGVLNIQNYSTQHWFSWVWWIGLIFSLLGFAYRELTIHASEIPSYHRLHRLLIKKESKSNLVTLGLIVRMVIIRIFLLLPVGAWFLLISIRSETAMELVLVMELFSAIMILVFSSIFCLIEWAHRYWLDSKDP